MILNPAIPALYDRFHKPEYISPDPLEIVREEADWRDREVVALISASLALGRVQYILSFQKELFRILGKARETCLTAEYGDLLTLLSGKRYRFYTENHIAALCLGIGTLLKTYGSLNDAFIYSRKGSSCLFGALENFVTLLREGAGGRECVVPDPNKGSACKRLFLFLRWMVRKDAIDPGGWTGISTAELLVPVDTHLLKTSLLLGLCTRRTADYKAAVEITGALSHYDREDPVKYDFALTRPGINPAFDYSCIEEYAIG